MIVNTGQRTDIPAFYAKWFAKRLKAGSVMVRNPYYPKIVTNYRLSPDVVDLICFCTKNPEPMFPYMDLLKPYRQFWFVTITPYGKDIEPHVPDKWKVMESFRKLSDRVGRKCVSWRYDPVFLTDRYSIAYHLRAFETMCSYLEGYTDSVVISFLDLYQKTRKNFPQGKEVSGKDMQFLGRKFKEITDRHHMTLRTCLEDHGLGRYGIDVSGCMTKEVLEQAVNEQLVVPSGHETRSGCHCLLGNDIGAYNTCMHGCRYCYADYDDSLVYENARKHDPDSPLLIGHLHKDDEIREAMQKSWITRQMKLDL